MARSNGRRNQITKKKRASRGATRPETRVPFTDGLLRLRKLLRVLLALLKPGGAAWGTLASRGTAWTQGGAHYSSPASSGPALNTFTSEDGLRS